MSKLPNVLLVTARSPWPVASGGQQRTFLLAEAIRRAANLHLLVIDPKPPVRPEDATVLRDRFGLVDDGIVTTRSPPVWRHRLNAGRTEFGRRPAIVRLVRDTASKVGAKIVVFRYLPLAARSVGADPDDLVRLVDVDDVPALRAQTEAQRETGIRKLAKGWIANRITRWQRRAIDSVDGGWVSCSDDLALIDAGDDFRVLPNIPIDAFDGTLDPALCRQNDGEPSVLFVGAMDYDINRGAMDWFLEAVWPLVRQQRPDATMRIAGGGLDDARRQRYGAVAGVELLGFVEDLGAEYRRAALSVVPINAGAGTKIKVLESLRFGRTVVLTSHSLRGYEDVLDSGRDVSVADEPAAMADAIAALLDSAETREAMARSGQHRVADHFGFDRFAGIVAQVLQDRGGHGDTPSRQALEGV